MQPQLIPERLNRLIDHHGMTITELEEKSRVSRRQIHDLKAKPDPSEPVTVRKTTLHRLAGALKVKPGVLSGELPMDLDAAAEADKPREELSARISARTRQHYDLACHRYRVTEEELIKMAPLLLTIVAEDSLKWRRERVKKQTEMIYAMADLAEFRGIDLFRSMDNGEESFEKLEWEKESIEKNELFGQSRMDRAGAEYRDPDQLNPFSEYLVQKIYTDLGPGILSFGEYEEGDPTPVGVPMVTEWGGENLPEYHLLREEIDRLLGLHRDQAVSEQEFKALFALKQCQVDIKRLYESITLEMPLTERTRLVLDSIDETSYKSSNYAETRCTEASN